ncbi:XapX domain-containing protein [Sphingomonas laterariae]|uniref:XapX domain-containing protein n=1 Tax=Edaphosphingomonas laterariae TaxID=861865 RepID=A0A239DI05_9SPHN|nr:XapX domain-containing protein [Sphingomonas laterariae]SNS31591.1 XapX domain-containing protein [Sphingomonas laterariae]
MADFKSYLVALGVGLLVGGIYGFLNVRSPAPPVVALVGLLGILVGEQLVPVAKRLMQGREVAAAFIRNDCAEHVLGQLPSAGSPCAGAEAVERGAQS